MKKFDVKGMTCAACAVHVEKSVKSVAGVKDVNVSLLSNSMTVDYDAPASDELICRAVEKGGYFAYPEGAKEQKNAKNTSAAGRLIASVILLVPLMYIVLGGYLPEFMRKPVFLGLTQLALCLPVIYLNRSYYFDGFKALFHLSPNMSSLIAIGSAAGFIYSIWALFYSAYMTESGMTVMTMYHFESSAMILTLISLGKYLESRAKDRTTTAISKLIDMSPKTANTVENGVVRVIPAADLKTGDICAVYDGGLIPADGTIIEGHGSIDMSMLTGESVPVELGAGETVAGATINREGYFTFRVDKVGEDTALSKIIKLVEAAANSKAPVSRLVDRVSGVFVPIVISIAAITLASWLIIGAGFEEAMQRAISVMVVSCPCALGLATPTAIMVGTGRGAELGIMVKSAASIELASRVKIAAFDKTGTLTEGGMSVSGVNAINPDMDKYAAAVEKLSSHPIAKAIAARANAETAATDYVSYPGKGVKAIVDGETVCVGNSEWLSENGVYCDKLSDWAYRRRQNGETVMFASLGNTLLGAYALTDAVRDEGKSAVKQLRDMGIKTVMLTGDNELTAKSVGDIVGVDTVYAGLLPGDKEKIIADLQKSGGVMMVGDGINDAPALTRADVGVAVSRGADVAIESADCVLIRDDPSLAAGYVKLGVSTMRNIKENLFWACIYNGVMIPVAAGAFSALGVHMSPALAAAAMSLSSLCVVTNALRLKRFKFEGAKTAPAKEIKEVKEEIKMKRTVHIEGMMCQNCVKHVNKALTGIGLAAEVDLSNNLAVVEGNADDEAIRLAVEDAGYTVTSIE